MTRSARRQSSASSSGSLEIATVAPLTCAAYPAGAGGGARPARSMTMSPGSASNAAPRQFTRTRSGSAAESTRSIVAISMMSRRFFGASSTETSRPFTVVGVISRARIGAPDARGPPVGHRKAERDKESGAGPNARSRKPEARRYGGQKQRGADPRRRLNLQAEIENDAGAKRDGRPQCEAPCLRFGPLAAVAERGTESRTYHSHGRAGARAFCGAGKVRRKVGSRHRRPIEYATENACATSGDRCRRRGGQFRAFLAIARQ